MKSLERAVNEFEPESGPPDLLSDIRERKKPPGAKIGRLMLALKPADRQLIATKSFT
jgi:hypothetical protein